MARVFAVALGVVSTMLTFAATSPDLEWSRQQVAYAMMANQGITYLLLVLPQIHKQAGNIRGNAIDN